jgi:hypothetical protein
VLDYSIIGPFAPSISPGLYGWTDSLLLYVDDIILTAFSTKLLRRTISALQQEFAMKDLGPLHHFLSITVERRPHLHTGGSSTCGHGSLQAVYDSSRHLGEACCGLRASGTGRLPVSEYRRCSSVPDVHPTRHRLHHAADLSTYARPQGA